MSRIFPVFKKFFRSTFFLKAQTGAHLFEKFSRIIISLEFGQLGRIPFEPFWANIEKDSEKKNLFSKF